MSQPFVSVVTPVHNGEPYLDECISSVLAQTFTNWEYIILNNGSTDRSLQIAQRYAAADPRIRVHSTDRLLPQLQNFNLAVQLASPRSDFYKIVEADDWIFPECLQHMVALGEAHPGAGVITSYQLAGTEVVGDGLPFPSPIVAGRDICRRHLLDGRFFVFGSPSGVLYKGDVVRQRVPFFNESAIHGDTDACYSILRTWDFGFVHEVLSYKRVDNAGICSGRRQLNPHALDKYIAFVTHGRHFLTLQEYNDAHRKLTREYHRLLARGLFYPNGWTQLRHHQAGLKVTLDYNLTLWALAPHILHTLVSFALNPAQTAQDAWRGIRRLLRRRGPFVVQGIRRHQA